MIQQLNNDHNSPLIHAAQIMQQFNQASKSVKYDIIIIKTNLYKLKEKSIITKNIMI